MKVMGGMGGWVVADGWWMMDGWMMGLAAFVWVMVGMRREVEVERKSSVYRKVRFASFVRVAPC